MVSILNDSTDAYFNLAAEEYLLRSFGQDVFMLWQNEPSVVIGKHQNVWAEINPAFIQERDIKVVRRSFGGGAVYQDLGNLNFTCIECSRNADFDKYTSLMVDLLAEVGVPAEADSRRGLTVQGLKISGSAQCIHRGKCMYHATLLYKTNLQMLASALQGDLSDSAEWGVERRAAYVHSVRSPVTNITHYLPSALQLQDFKNIIISFLLKKKIVEGEYQFSPYDLQAINQLKEEKYATTQWNFQATAPK